MQDQTTTAAPFTVIDSDDYANVFSFAVDDRRATGMVIRSTDADTPEMRAALDGLNAGMVDFTEKATVHAMELHPARLSAAQRASAARILPQPFKALQKTGTASRQSRTEWLHSMNQVHNVDPAIATALTPGWMNATLTQVAERTKTANSDALAVLISMRSLIEIPDEMWQLITRRYIAIAITEGKMDGGSSYPKIQTPAQAFATGINAASVIQTVNDQFDQFDQRGERLDDIEASIGGLVALIATATEQNIVETWAMLTGK